MPVAAATKEFVQNVVGENVSSELYCLVGAVTYYMHYEDCDELRRTLRSDAETSILTGLLSQRNLEIAVQHDLVCNTYGALGHWPAHLLELAVCYGRTLFASGEPTTGDRDAFTHNMVELLCLEDEMVAWIIKKSRQSRIVGHWILCDGGTERPRDVFGNTFVTAHQILLYDRFFRKWTLDTIVDALDFARTQRGEPLSCNITVYVGFPGKPSESGFVDYAALPSMLTPFLRRGSSVTVEKIAPAWGRRHSLHDRFMQVDNSSTFIFTAGLGCFFEGRGSAGPNRSSHIFQLQVSPNFETFDFEVQSGRGRKRCTIRT